MNDETKQSVSNFILEVKQKIKCSCYLIESNYNSKQSTYFIKAYFGIKTIYYKELEEIMKGMKISFPKLSYVNKMTVNIRIKNTDNKSPINKKCTYVPKY